MRLPVLLLLMALALPASAQELFVSNRPYEGSFDGNRVQLKAFLNCLSMKMIALGEGACIRAESDPDKCSTDHDGVYYQGQRLETAQLSDGQFTAELSELSQVLGGRLVPNSELGTLDFYLIQSPREEASTSARRILSFANLRDARRIRHLLEDYAQSSQTELVVMDVRDRSSEDFQAYGAYLRLGPLPYTVLVDPSGRVVGNWTGMPNAESIARDHQLYLQRQAQIRQQQAQVTSRRSTGQRFSPSGGG